jgi:Glycosyl transferase family 2
VVTLPDGPVQVFDVELSGLQRLPPVDGGPARLLVRRHGAPVTLCVVDVPPEGLEPAAFAERLTHLIGPVAGAEDGVVGDVDAARRARRRELAAHGPHMTVQIATHDRPGPLRRCLDSVAAVDYPALDVIVIDNAARDDEARAVVHAWQQAHPDVAVRYLREPVAGAARAHNRSLEVAEGDWVVRTDDDVDPQWLAAIADAATCAPDVQCVSEARVRRAVREAGFTSACTVKNALSAPDDPPYTLSRLMVMATTTDDELIGWLAGRGVPVGRDDERLLTRGWRWWRRARARVGAQPPGWADAA